MAKTNESSEDYLERILMLTLNGNEDLHAKTLAESFSYSKPSVSIALKKLEEKHLVTIDFENKIQLTKEGKEIASKIYERHQTLGKFFTMIGVSEENAYLDACKIEHDLSQESFLKIKEIVDKEEKSKK